jgi:NlpC/P60 family protein
MIASIVTMVGALILAILYNIVSQEARGRLERLPMAVLHLAAKRQLPPDIRDSVHDSEWLPELEAILRRSEGLPITRLVRGTRYAASLLRAPKQLGNDLAIARGNAREPGTQGSAVLRRSAGGASVFIIVAALLILGATSTIDGTIRPQLNGTGEGNLAANWALTQLGKPYQWGGSGPGSYDCSGLALMAWAHAGVQLLHYTGYQWEEGPHVPIGHLRRGDLVFYATNTTDPSTIHHVGIYIGNGMMVNAPYTGAFVRIDSIYAPGGLIGAIRPWA